MKIRNTSQRKVVKQFKKSLKEYPYVFPYYEGEVIFDNSNHSHVCFARLCGASVFKQVCPNHKAFRNKVGFIGMENCCDNCIYDIRIDFNRSLVCCDTDGVGKIGLLGKPQIKLCCDKKLIDTY